ncbi:PepSY-associated TM helix [Pararhodospirillum photometricum DSM 122]|uniref:PepSY-associated TM helix n=1 Tax=Pararhodospirillum photometricum DSM 122 TaxID=1150469 RepID=H6SMV6_PARPM|nr:PepSY-associated TM helix [Pararhodospirillum photometricum DSM 122]
MRDCRDHGRGEVVAGGGEDLALWHARVYYAVFFGGVAWAFWRGAERACGHLLGLGAVLAAALPLTSLVGRLVPALGWWGHVSPAALAVDGGALLMAVGLGVLAWRTGRR